jgi:hypothetical protein
MRRRRFSSAAVASALKLTACGKSCAQQHNIDTQNSTLTIHVSKTGIFSGLGHEHEVRASIHSVRRTRARILRWKCTWMRGSYS